MKKLLFIVFAVVVMQGCDKIDSPYSTGGNNIVVVDTTNRKILLEEFTGHTCPNCPDAHNEAQTLLNAYGDQLIVISIHTGYYAHLENHPDSSFSYDFRTQVGNDIFSRFMSATQSFPTGMIERKKNTQNNYATAYGAWGTNMASIAGVKASAKLNLSNTFNAVARTITTSVNTGVLKDLQDSLSLVVLFTEDSIINWQKDGTLNIPDYVHRHVLRGSLNGSWGELLGTSFTNGQEINKTYTSSAIHADAAPEHISVIAILYDASTYQVVQVAQKKLLP